MPIIAIVAGTLLCDRAHLLQHPALFPFRSSPFARGMMLFTLGAELAMSPMGERVGTCLTKSRKLRW